MNFINMEDAVLIDFELNLNTKVKHHNHSDKI